jgi:hypothetical protein
MQPARVRCMCAPIGPNRAPTHSTHPLGFQNGQQRPLLAVEEREFDAPLLFPWWTTNQATLIGSGYDSPTTDGVE